MGKNRLILGLLVTCLAVTFGVFVAKGSFMAEPAIEVPFLGFYEGERDDGGYFTIVGPDGNIIDKTARVVYVGDEFIAADNKHYRIQKVEGDTAIAENIGTEEIVWKEEWEQAQAQGQQNAKNLVAIYHTHSAESYVPTDGTESKPANGGIFQVGDALAAKLREKGINVLHDKTPHEPRDANAYKRSRRTATKLLQKRPAAIIDVHRDGVPDPEFYRGEVAGTPVTKVRLVVGRQNGNMQANLDFAKRVKAYMDKAYPGLIRGIFVARGNYNQDLTPRSLLIEVGTHTNSRERAENGAALFADAIPHILGIAAPPSGRGPGPFGPGKNVPSTRGDWSALLWVIGILVVGGGAFLLLSTGSWKGSIDKLKQLTSTEWSSFLGKRHVRHNVQESDLNSKRFYVGELSKAGEKEPAETNDERAEYQKD